MPNERCVERRIMPSRRAVTSCRRVACFSIDLGSGCVCRRVVPCHCQSRHAVACCIVPSWHRVVPSQRAITACRRPLRRAVTSCPLKLTWQHELWWHNATGNGTTQWMTAWCDGQRNSTMRQYNATAQRKSTTRCDWWQHDTTDNGTTQRLPKSIEKQASRLAMARHDWRWHDGRRHDAMTRHDGWQHDAMARRDRQRNSMTRCTFDAFRTP